MNENNDHQSVGEVKREKLSKIKNLGVMPYADKANRTDVIANILLKFEGYIDKEIQVCGRIMARREHGKAIFADIKDESAQIQLHIKADNFKNNEFEFINDLVDIGDFLEITGKAFVTKRGEKTIEVLKYKFLSKALESLPEKWKGLQDAEKKHRLRYLDLLMDDGLRKRFKTRAEVISSLRQFMDERGYTEVETPILQSTAGGAIAKSFNTFYNAFDCEVKLRIAPELYLKRLFVGGFERVYEIGKVFRNEGRDPSHLQEFTMFEYYQAYSNYEDLMKMTEEMMKSLLEKVVGTTKIRIGEREIDMTPPYPRMTFFELIKEYGKVDLSFHKTADDLRQFIAEQNLDIDGDISVMGYGKLIDEIYKKIARPHVINPVFLVDHPLDLSPLSRIKDNNPDLVDRFQLVVNGWEICNAFSELIDPIDQRRRFEEQASLKAGGDEEAHSLDEDYLDAMSYGMPPIAGWGMGIDRLMSLITGIDNLRELVLFPFVKPKNQVANNPLIVDKKEVFEGEFRQEQELISDLNKQEKKNLFQEILTDEQLNDLNQEVVGISRDEALVVMKENLNNINLQKHSLAVEAILRKMADKLGADADVWGLAGLLHDLDYEQTMKEPTQHCLITTNILKEKGVNPLILQAIRAHNPACGGVVSTRLDKAIYCADPLSGFITASALVQPNKSLAEVSVESMLKKFKDKSFAKGADRNSIKACEQMGLTLEEFMKLGLEAMLEIRTDLGL